MSNQRLHAIQEWAEKAINLDPNANTAIALGVALAHINELVTALTAANAETLRLQMELNLKAIKTEPNPFIFTPPNPLKPWTTTPFVNDTPGNPLTQTYGLGKDDALLTSAAATTKAEEQIRKMIQDYKDEIAAEDKVEIPVADGNAEFKTDFYGVGRNYETPVTTALEKDLGAALMQAAIDSANKLKTFEEKLQDALDKNLDTPVIDGLVDDHSALKSVVESMGGKTEAKANPMQELLDNDSWSINSVERVNQSLDNDAARYAASCANLEQKYDEELFTKPTTLKSLLDKHFEEADGEPIFVAQIKTPVIDELTVCNEEESKQFKNRNNLPIEQQLGIAEFTGTTADLPDSLPKNISWADRRLREQGITIPKSLESVTEIVQPITNTYRINTEAHNQLVESLVQEDAKVVTEGTTQAFVNKYGGEVAVIDTPFEGLAILAPGMDEAGHIEDTSRNYHQEQIIAQKLRDQQTTDQLLADADAIRSEVTEFLKHTEDILNK